MIFDIQKFSIHDGPGIRTTVFFKGCPLKCLWCSNPESQSAALQLMHFEERCTHCGDCIEVCPSNAISRADNEKVVIDHQACDACGACVDECLANARSISGKEVAIEEICRIVKQDFSYYQNSGGGVTISGGEPLFQPEFLLELLPKLNEAGVHICLDTCGFGSWDVLEKAVKFVDMVLLDNKHMDSEAHKKLTGVSNELILENTKKLAGLGVPVIIRVPLIPGLNDSEKNITQLGQFMKDCNLPEVNLLPYHAFSRSKHEALGFSYDMDDVPDPSEDEIQRVTNILEGFDRTVTVVK